MDPTTKQKAAAQKLLLAIIHDATHHGYIIFIFWVQKKDHVVGVIVS
jgi:hypothetical protein